MINGRAVLRPAPGLAVYRIATTDPAKGGSDTPVTDALTIYHRWAVACESRLAAKSCFATAYVRGNQATVKMRFGAAADEATNGRPGAAALTDASGNPRYVMTIEGPPGLDEAAGLSVSGTTTFGILPLSHGCTKVACTASAFVQPRDIAGTGGLGSGGEPALSVTGTVGELGYVWRFSEQGLAKAFARVMAEMTAPQGQPTADAAPERMAPAPGAHARGTAGE